jgi:hypothetical protein
MPDSYLSRDYVRDCRTASTLLVCWPLLVREARCWALLPALPSFGGLDSSVRTGQRQS